MCWRLSARADARHMMFCIFRILTASINRRNVPKGGWVSGGFSQVHLQLSEAVKKKEVLEGRKAVGSFLVTMNSTFQGCLEDSKVTQSLSFVSRRMLEIQMDRFPIDFFFKCFFADQPRFWLSPMFGFLLRWDCIFLGTVTLILRVTYDLSNE